MKKRLFILVLLTFLLCGCSATVNISINDSTINERISIQEAPYGDASINDIAQQYRKYIPAFKDTIMVDTMPDVATDGVKYYRTSSTEVNGLYNAYYQYDYNFREYKNATSINNAFKSSMVQYDSYEKQILITTEASGMVLFSSYPQLENVRINISTNYKVLESNADYSSGNVYTWEFNRDTKKGVYLLLQDLTGKSVGGIKKENEKEPEKKEEQQEEKQEDKEQEEKEEITTPKKEENKQEEKGTVQKSYEKIKEKGTKHPHVVVIIAIVVFLVIVLFSFRVKKV